MSYIPSAGNLSGIVSVTAAAGGTTLNQSSWGVIIRATAILGNVNIVLPNPVGAAGQRIEVVRLDAGSQFVVNVSNAQGISGVGSGNFVISSLNASAIFQSNGTTIDVMDQCGNNSAFNPTNKKISAYTASAYDLVLCDTSGGAFSVTPPPSPYPNMRFAVTDVAGNFATNPLTVVTSNGGGSFMGVSQDLVLQQTGTYTLVNTGSAAAPNWVFGV